VLVVHGDLLIVSDFIDATDAHAAAVHWHIHPDWTVEVQHRRVILMPREALSGAVEFVPGSGARRSCSVVLVAAGGDIDVFRGESVSGLGWYSPVYGRMLAATTIRVTHAAAGSFWLASVFDLGSGNPIRGVEWLPVSAVAGRLAHGAGLCISRAGTIDRVLWAEPQPAAADKPDDCGIPGRAAADAGLVWRSEDLVTDARLVFSRSDPDGQMTWLALVDGSVARDAAGGTYAALPQPVPVWDSASCSGGLQACTRPVEGAVMQAVGADPRVRPGPTHASARRDR
jgi:hypothetical protein